MPPFKTLILVVFVFLPAQSNKHEIERGQMRDALS